MSGSEAFRSGAQRVCDIAVSAPVDRQRESRDHESDGNFGAAA